MPEISASAPSSSQRSWSVPCEMASGASGCRLANPGSRAAHSLSFGLNFIVHEPSG